MLMNLRTIKLFSYGRNLLLGFFPFIIFFKKTSVLLMILLKSGQCCAPSQHYDQKAKTVFDSRIL